MIDFKCLKCKQPMSSPESMAGKEETCPNCGNIALVPNSTPPIPVRAAPIQQVPQPASQHVSQQARLDVIVKGIKSANGLGIAALVLGILATLSCWIPFVGIVGIPLAILGLLFGVIGFLIALTGRKSGVGMPISGCIVCIVSIIVAVASTGGYRQKLQQGAEQTRQEQAIIKVLKQYIGPEHGVDLEQMAVVIRQRAEHVGMDQAMTEALMRLEPRQLEATVARAKRLAKQAMLEQTTKVSGQRVEPVSAGPTRPAPQKPQETRRATTMPEDEFLIEKFDFEWTVVESGEAKLTVNKTHETTQIVLRTEGINWLELLPADAEAIGKTLDDTDKYFAKMRNAKQVVSPHIA